MAPQELAAKPDLNPQSAHYIWHADNNLAKAAVVRLVCKSLQNLRIKLAHEKRTAAVCACFATPLPPFVRMFLHLLSGWRAGYGVFSE